MKKQKLISIEKNLDKKFLKMYTAHYETDGKPRNYVFTSRHDEADLSIKNMRPKPTAIEAITYFQDKKGDIMVVMIKEFRSALGNYVYSFPAGLLEKDEDPIDAAKREIKEELGADVKKIEYLQSYPIPICPGMTDEANYFFIAELSEIGKQELEDTEDIDVEIVSLKQLKEDVKNNKVYLTLSGYFGVTKLSEIF